MNRRIPKHKQLNRISGALYILKQKVFIESLYSKPIECYETIGVCTKLSDAVKIKEENKDAYLFTIDK